MMKQRGNFRQRFKNSAIRERDEIEAVQDHDECGRRDLACLLKYTSVVSP